MINLGNVLQVKNLLPVASVTSDGNGSGVDIQSLEGQIAIVLDCSAPVAGSSPTMDVKFKIHLTIVLLQMFLEQLLLK